MRRIGHAMDYIQDDPKLPRVLLIGDSISFYYTDPVRTMLRRKANVHRIPDNGRATTHGLEDMQKWLNNEKWDIIHFNFGLHDITRTSKEEYKNNLEKIVQVLQGTSAELVWASTTPVPAETQLITPDAVLSYNALARQVMDEHHIPIDDLYSYMLPYVDRYKLFPGNEHFNTGGSAYLAKKVGQTIADLLDRHPRR